MASVERYVYPVFGALPVDAIDTGLVMQVLEPMWNDKPETASRVRGRIESVLDWSKARGYRSGENPARCRGHIENLLPKKSKLKPVAHFAALPYLEVPAFMAELRQHDDAGAGALEFGILTAGRSGEVLVAQWTEINFTERLWTVPPERMKRGREHRVPLSDAALAMLEKQKAVRCNDFVFAGAYGNDHLGANTLRQVLQRLGRSDLTPHGFRSTFADWCTEQTDFPSEVREMALAHAVGNKVEEAYRRGDLAGKRRALAEAWAGYCGSVVRMPTKRVA